MYLFSSNLLNKRSIVQNENDIKTIHNQYLLTILLKINILIEKFRWNQIIKFHYNFFNMEWVLKSKFFFLDLVWFF